MLRRRPFAPTPDACRASGSDLIAAIVTTLVFWAESVGCAFLAVAVQMTETPAPIPHWIDWSATVALAALAVGLAWLGARPFGLRPVIVRSPGRVGIAYELPLTRQQIIARAAARRTIPLAVLNAHLDVEIND